MADPATLEEALSIIEDLTVERQSLVEIIDHALTTDEEDHKHKARNKVTFAYGRVRRMGRNLSRQLQWTVDNLAASIPPARQTNMEDLLQKWEDSPFTKFDEDDPIPLPPP